MLLNRTRGKEIQAKVRIAEDPFSRMKGLMFENENKFDYALVFELPSESRIRASIHMMFVFFPIEVVYLDSQKKVVDIAKVNPWTLNYTPKKPAKYFIELKSGLSKGIKAGDFLEWNASE